MEKAYMMKGNAEKPVIDKWLKAVEGAGSAPSLRRWISKPRRDRVAVNLGKLERHVKNDEAVIVPGKVLGTGSISKRFSISAMEFSGSARNALQKAGCEILDISEMVKRKNARIIV